VDYKKEDRREANPELTSRIKMQSTIGNKAIKAQSKVNSKTSLWLSNALIVGIGGMIFTGLMQWMMQACAVAWHGGNNIDPDAKMWSFLPLLLLGLYGWMTYNGGFGAYDKKEEEPKSRYSYRYDAPDSSSSLGTIIVFALFLFAYVGTVNMPMNFAILLICLSSLGMLAMGMLQMLYEDRWARRYASLTWLFGYFALWIMSSIFSTVSLLIFIVNWVILGALGGNTVTFALKKAAHEEYHTAGHAWRASDVTKEQVQRSRRARMTSSVVSQYGRVPQDTFDLLVQQVRRVTGPVASALPILSSNDVRNITIVEVLTVTLRDWRENDNLQGLQATDVEDLRSFVEAAASLAGDLQTPESIAIYKTSLRALLLDWLNNWNVDGCSGPPLRR
jgi:hypothetical protein